MSDATRRSALAARSHPLGRPDVDPDGGKGRRDHRPGGHEPLRTRPGHGSRSVARVFGLSMVSRVNGQVLELSGGMR